jgi:16S rRNA (guanine966-N2)-methyltransferase
LRIVGGKHSGRLIEAPNGHALRPTADRVRESVFNILTQGGTKMGGRDCVAGARVLDGFAGTGALGLEAASRGAAHVSLMENNRTALDTCRRNVAALGEQGAVSVLSGDCLHPVHAAEPCALILLDPPYNQGGAAPALVALSDAGWIAEDAICVIELAAKEEFTPPDGFDSLDQRRYGAARVVFLRWSPA